VVQLAEAGVHDVISEERVAGAVVTVLEPIGVGAVRGDDPALIDDAAEAVEAGVLVAGVAVGLAGLLDGVRSTPG
jgi:hypothetical protein